MENNYQSYVYIQTKSSALKVKIIVGYTIVCFTVFGKVSTYEAFYVCEECKL